MPRCLLAGGCAATAPATLFRRVTIALIGDSTMTNYPASVPD